MGRSSPEEQMVLLSKYSFSKHCQVDRSSPFGDLPGGYDVCLFQGVSPCYDVSPCYVVTNGVKGGIKYRTQGLKDLLISSILYFTDILRLPHSPILSSKITTFMIPVSFSFSKAVKSMPVIKALSMN